MEPSVNERKEGIGNLAFVIGGLSYIPLIGILFGIASVLWGLLSKKKAGKKVALIGAGGIAFTFVIYGGLFYFGMIQRGGVYDELRTKLAQSQLNQLVQSVEFYKVTHGSYPDTLEQLQKAFPNATFVYDPTDMPHRTKLRYFYYKPVDENHYYLRSVGADGQPFTADDIVPQIDASLADKIGLVTSPQSSK